jgi:putative ABC transport system permease protein
MNILHRFTRKSLLANRSRTLVTIIGIILSMALFTAVIEGAYSGQQFLIRSVEEKDGRWLVFDAELTQKQADALRETEGIADSAVWQEVGWGEIESLNEYKPYLLVESIDDGIESMLSVHLVSGRLPENENEILLPAHLASNGGVHYSEGDTLNIALGQRVDESGAALSAFTAIEDGKTESIRAAKEHRYTVVGVYERLSTEVEDFGCPGYTALTRGGGTGDCTVFYTLKHPSSVLKWCDAHPSEGFLRIHSDLRRFNGVFGSESFNLLLYGFAGVLVFLIAFGSISLIYNSFSISVSERTRQLGILKSVGATKKQIRASVLYEALALSAVGIPIGLIVGCAGIGITLYCLRDAFAGMLFTGSTTQMRLVLHPLALLISAVVCLVTTLISAAIPARRAIRVSPIDSVRQTADVKLKAKEVYTSRFTEKLFGFEGTMASKNFKRNRRRYRSTIVSLFLSVVLFISASSFCAYLTDSVNSAADTEHSTDIQYYTVGEHKENPDEVLKMLRVDGVTDALYYDMEGRDLYLPRDVVAADLSSGADVETWFGYLIFVQDDAFRALCEANDLDSAPYFDPEHPMALIWNENRQQVEKNGHYQWINTPTLDVSKLPGKIYIPEPKELDGYIFGDITTLEDGTSIAIYYPIDEKSGEPQWDQPKEFPASEVETRVPFEIGAAIEQTTFGLGARQFTLYYPYSMEAAVLGEENLMYQTYFAFQAPEHAKVFDAMKTKLNDAGMDATRLHDSAADEESVRMLVKVVNVFSYGFIILISLIAVANVFNTISTNVSLRRREFAMLRSIGLGNNGFRRMMNYECIIYGVKGLVWGLPAAIGMTWVIWRITNQAFESSFYVPWYSIAIAVGSVFLVVFVTMLYAMDKIKKDNTIDALKNENM